MAKEYFIGNVKGPKGDKGDTGSQGARGIQGKSAYESAIDGGYTGTEKQFNTDLSNLGELNAILDNINGEVI